jgi:hypothetical protein
MTTAENVRRAVAEYRGIELAQVTDDLRLDDHMAPTFIAIKLGLAYSGTIGGTITVGELIAAFVKKAETDQPLWDYEVAPKSLREAVIRAVAKGNGLKVEDVTDDTPIGKEYEVREKVSDILFSYIGFGTTLDYRYSDKTVKDLIADMESMRQAIGQGI